MTTLEICVEGWESNEKLKIASDEDIKEYEVGESLREKFGKPVFIYDHTGKYMRGHEYMRSGGYRAIIDDTSTEIRIQTSEGGSMTPKLPHHFTIGNLKMLMALSPNIRDKGSFCLVKNKVMETEDGRKIVIEMDVPDDATVGELGTTDLKAIFF